MERKNPAFIFFLALVVLSLVLLGRLLAPFFAVLVLAFVVTGIFVPVYGLFCRKLPPGAASLLTCVLIFLVLFIPLVVFVGILSNEAWGLYTLAKDSALDKQVVTFIENNRILDRATDFLARYGVSLTADDLNRGLQEAGRVVGGFLWTQANAIASNVLSFVLQFFFMLMIIYFFLIDGKRFVDTVVDLSPLPDEQDRKIIGKFKDMSGAILLGNGFCGVIQGIAGGLTFFAMGLGSPFLWGVIMGVLAFLPIVGISLVMLPAAGVLFIKGRVAAGVAMIVIFVIVSTVIEYIVKPRLVGHRVAMHPLLVFLAIVGGLKLFGIIGIIYGPLMVTLFLTLTDIYQVSYRPQILPEPPSGEDA